MTNLEKSKAVIDAMDNIELWTRSASRYFNSEENMTFEEYKNAEERVQKAKEIIFNLVMDK